MTIKAVLFDKDGTLLDFDATFIPASVKVINDLANGDEELAKQISHVVEFDLENSILKPESILIAGSLDDIAESLMPLLKAKSAEILSKQVDELYIKYSLETVVAFDFLESSLSELETMNLSLGVATNDSEDGALSHLTKLAVSTWFCFIAGFNSGFGSKPEPGMVLGFAEQLGILPSEVAMVGDSTHDCDAGRAAGALAIGVTSGSATAEELSPHADHVLPNISALPGLIAKLNEMENSP